MNIYNSETAANKILSIYEKYGHKRGLHIIKKDSQLSDFINSHILKLYPSFDESFVTNRSQLFFAKTKLLLLKNFDMICPYGKQKKFGRSHSIWDFRCPSMCRCNIDKRQHAIKNKYGSSNVFQTVKINNKRKNTNLKIYGFVTPLLNPEIQKRKDKTMKANCFHENGVFHHSQIHYSQKAREVMFNKEKFSEMLIQMGTKIMAESLGVTKGKIRQTHKKLGLNILSQQRSCYEKEIAIWLEKENVNFIANDRSQIKPKELDFYIPSQKLAIEFQGDYWHANPKQYKSSDIIRLRKNTLQAQEIWKKDAHKKKLCTDKGITLFTIWESEWNENPENVKIKILENLKERINTCSE